MNAKDDFKSKLICLVEEGINMQVDLLVKRRFAQLFARYHRGEIEMPDLKDFASLVRPNELEHYLLAEELICQLKKNLKIDSEPSKNEKTIEKTIESWPIMKSEKPKSEN